MTLDQYLVTCAWLFIATTIGLIIAITRDAVVNMNRHPSMCDCRKCTGPYGVKKKYTGYDTSDLGGICILSIALPIFILSLAFRNRSIARNNFIVNWLIIIAFWSAYPLYLWVSTSFAFNITYIGG